MNWEGVVIDDDIIENLIGETADNARNALNKIKQIQNVSLEEAQTLANLFVPFWKSDDIALKTLANEAFVNLKRQHPSISYPQELMNSTVGVRKLKERFGLPEKVPEKTKEKSFTLPKPPVIDETRHEPKPTPVLQPRREGLQISQYFSEGWEIFLKGKWHFIGFTFATAALSILAFPLLFMPQVYFAGTLLIAFRIMKNEAYEFTDFFCFRYWWPVTQWLLATVFCQIPIITYPWVLSWFFTIPFVIDKDLVLSDGFDRSKEVLSSDWLSVLGFVLLLLVVIIVGAVVYGVGLLVTAPFAHCVIAAAYRDKVGLK